MEIFKIHHYEREHGPGSFMPFRHLSSEEADTVRRSLLQRLELPSDLDGLEMIKMVEARSTVLKGVEAESDDFDLRHILEELAFEVAETVYLNWHRFDNLDEFRAVDVFANFDDIWYPSADDLDIVDSKLNWILSITHYGAVSALGLGTVQEARISG